MRSPLTALILAVAAFAALVAPAAAAPMIGMGDQSARLFDDTRFTNLSKVKVVRYIAPWDVDLVPEAQARAEAWISAARAKGYLVHFTFNYGSRNPAKNPTPAAYVKATRPFVMRHRTDVESWGVFNEVNRGTAAGRFTTPGPRLAGQLFKAFRGQVCGSCKIVGIDLLDGNDVKPALAYLKAFYKETGASRPKIVGFHNYSDTNRKSSERTGALLKGIGAGPKVWITETGGLYQFGSEGKGWLPDAQRQAAAVRQVFKIAKRYPRLERLIFYNFYAPGPDQPDDIFDAGLISGDDELRPAYRVFQSFAK